MSAVLEAFGGAVCALCGEELRVEPSGWVHPTESGFGGLYGADGHEVVPITRAAYVAGRGGK